MRRKTVFTALPGMPARTSYEKCVSLSNTCIVTKRKKDICQDFLYHTYKRSVSLVFREEWLGVIPSTWNFESSWPRWSEIADCQSIFARSASAV